MATPSRLIGMKTMISLLLMFLSLAPQSMALQLHHDHRDPPRIISRRSALLVGAAPSLFLLSYPQEASAAPAPPPDLVFTTAPSGLQWADYKTGSGQPLQRGSPVAIDYVMSTTGARYGSKIYSSKDSNAPYRWTLGDGTTIAGLEQAILGDDSVPPMQPGGIRRVIIPSTLGYTSLAKPIAGLQYQDCQEGKGVGPIPPASEGAAGEYYQRFKNIYCNANRPYQPDLVMDVKLYGKRTSP